MIPKKQYCITRDECSKSFMCFTLYALYFKSIQVQNPPPIKYGELTSMLSRQLGDTTHSGVEK